MLPLVLTATFGPGDWPLTSSSPSTRMEPLRPSLQWVELGQALRHQVPMLPDPRRVPPFSMRLQTEVFAL